MMKKHDRPVVLMTAVQGMLCGASAVAVGAWGISVCAVLRDLTAQGFDTFSLMTAVTLLCATGIAACALAVMVEMFHLCGRVKRETAFTERNVLSLGRVMTAFAGMAALFLPVGKPLMDWFMWELTPVGGSAWMLLPSFVCSMVVLMVRAIQLLLRRAVDMQDEQDLTV